MSFRSFMLAAAVCLCAALPASAADFTAPLLDLDGVAIKQGDKEVTLGEVAANSLLGNYPDERELVGDEKLRRLELALKVRAARDPKLTPEEIALIKKLVSKAYGPLVSGRAWQVLNDSVK